MLKLGEKQIKFRNVRKKKSKISGFLRNPSFQPGHCFFKVQCKMNSDASNHELIKIDDKESIRCHILKCFEI